MKKSLHSQKAGQYGLKHCPARDRVKKAKNLKNLHLPLWFWNDQNIIGIAINRGETIVRKVQPVTAGNRIARSAAR